MSDLVGCERNAMNAGQHFRRFPRCSHSFYAHKKLRASRQLKDGSASGRGMRLKAVTGFASSGS